MTIPKDDCCANLISVIADIREKSGVGGKPMLSELADHIQTRIEGLKTELEIGELALTERNESTMRAWGQLAEVQRELTMTQARLANAQHEMAAARIGHGQLKCAVVCACTVMVFFLLASFQ